MQLHQRIVVYAFLVIGFILVSSAEAATLPRLAALNQIIESLDKGITMFGLLAERIEDANKVALQASGNATDRADAEILTELQSDLTRIITDKRNLIDNVEQFYQKKTQDGKTWTADIIRINGQILMVLRELLEQDSRFKVKSFINYQRLLNNLYRESDQLRLLSETNPKELSAVEHSRLKDVTTKLKKEIEQMKKARDALDRYIKKL